MAETTGSFSAIVFFLLCRMAALLFFTQCLGWINRCNPQGRRDCCEKCDSGDQEGYDQNGWRIIHAYTVQNAMQSAKCAGAEDQSQDQSQGRRANSRSADMDHRHTGGCPQRDADADLARPLCYQVRYQSEVEE
jgi:hypothetical protein